MLVGPRTRSDQEQGGAGGLFGSGNPVGYFVFTPFKLEESGEVILVNRGWIPRNARDQRSRREGQVGFKNTCLDGAQSSHYLNEVQIPGLVEIEGILREGESSSALTIPNNPQKNEWYTISTSEMAQVTGASTTLVELVAGVFT